MSAARDIRKIPRALAARAGRVTGSRTARAVRLGLRRLREGGPVEFVRWAAAEALPAEARTFAPMQMPVAEPLDRPRAFGGVRVGTILDAFSETAWGGEFDTVALTPDNWRGRVDDCALLLVESAWAGSSGTWRGALTGPHAPSGELRALVTHCREQGIPTVFWNKEDPPHFADFLDTARLFDTVLTSDSDKIPAYREALGHDRVAAMAFAAQPAVHNPVRPPRGLKRRGGVAFAGSYFRHKFPERRAQLDLLLSAALTAERHIPGGLTVYSRFVGQERRYQFPAPFDARVVGALPYERMLTAYKAFRVFLNVNSVVDSPSMCARRLFEIPACGTPVVTTPSAAVRRFFTPRQLTVVDDEETAARAIRALAASPQLADRIVHRAQREIWARHTYTDRARQVLTAAGVDAEPGGVDRDGLISVLCPTRRPGQIDHLIAQIARQRDVDIEVLVATHGFTASTEIDEACARHGLDRSRVRVFDTPPEATLGWCLNMLADAARGTFAAKFDDDDIYCAHYLRDQLNALFFSGADLVGKHASYLYLGARDEMILRNPQREHTFSRFVAGPTLFTMVALLREFPFPEVDRGEDTGLLRALEAAGRKVYSADRFNFVQVRSGQGHTWAVDEATLLSTGRVETYGLNEAHVTVD